MIGVEMSRIWLLFGGSWEVEASSLCELWHIMRVFFRGDHLFLALSGVVGA
jgi:hypothetical protein